MLAQFFDLSVPIYERNIRVKINVDDNLTATRFRNKIWQAIISFSCNYEFFIIIYNICPLYANRQSRMEFLP